MHREGSKEEVLQGPVTGQTSPLPQELWSTPPPKALLTNHGRQHCRVGGLSPEHEQGQAPAERNFWFEDCAIKHLQHRGGALDRAHSLIWSTSQGYRQEAFSAALLPSCSWAVGRGDLQREGKEAQLLFLVASCPTFLSQSNHSFAGLVPAWPKGSAIQG